MDTFWVLSSPDPVERTNAAQCLLVHCFPQLDASDDSKTTQPVEDCAYALKRLLDGVCSGRASARQGFGSALTGFLGMLKTIDSKEIVGTFRSLYGNKDESDMETDDGETWIRAELLRRTAPQSTGTDGGAHAPSRKKSVEERDCALGRLFGILAVARSGLLKETNKTISSLQSEFAKDIVLLYKKFTLKSNAQLRDLCCYTLLEYVSIVGQKQIILQEMYDVVLEPFVSDWYAAESNDTDTDENQPTSSSVRMEKLSLVLYLHTRLTNDSLKTKYDAVLTKLVSIAPQIVKQLVMEQSTEDSPADSTAPNLAWNQLVPYFHKRLTNTNQQHDEKEMTQCTTQMAEFWKECIASLYQLTTNKNTALTSITSATNTLLNTLLSFVSIKSGKQYVYDALDIRGILTFCNDILTRPAPKTKQTKEVSNTQQQAQAVLSKIVALSSNTQLLMKECLILSPHFIKNVTSIKCTSTNTMAYTKGMKDFACSSSYLEFLKEQIINCQYANRVTSGREESNEKKLSGYLDLYGTACHDLCVSSSNDDDIRKQQEGILTFLLLIGYFQPTDGATTNKKRLSKNDILNQCATKLIENNSQEISDDSKTEDDIVTHHRNIKLIQQKFRSVLYTIYHQETHPAQIRNSKDTEESQTSFDEQNNKKSWVLECIVSLLDVLVLPPPTAPPASGKKKKKKKQPDEQMHLTNLFTFCHVTKDSKMSPRWIESREILIQQAKLQSSSPGSSKEEALQYKAQSGIYNLMMTLYLQMMLLREEAPSVDKKEKEEASDSDEEEAYDEALLEREEDVVDLLSDLTSVAKKLVSEDDNEEESDGDEGDDGDGPTPPTLEIMACACIQILSDTAGSDKNATTGMNAKLLKNATMDAWGKTLTSMGVDDERSTKLGGPLSSETCGKTLDILLESVCGSLYVGEGDLVDGDVEEDADMEEDDDTDGEEGGNDEGDEVFTLSNAKNAASMFDDSDDDTEESDPKTNADTKVTEKSKEEDIMLDSDQLQNMLLHSDDDDDDILTTKMLEHTEEADGALMSLIAMQKERRKGKAMERERSALVLQLRCLPLLETLVTKKRQGHGGTSLISVNMMCHTTTLLVSVVRLMETNINTTTKNSTSTIHSKTNIERRTLCDKIIAFLKKACKVKLFVEVEDDDSNAVAMNDDANVDGKGLSVKDPLLSTAATILQTEALKSPNREHLRLCSSFVLQLLRIAKQTVLPYSDSKMDSISESLFYKISNLYQEPLKDWLTKRNTTMNPSLFDDFILRHSHVAAIVLAPDLVKAAGEARSSYLKSESFRLLSEIFLGIKREEKAPQQQNDCDKLDVAISTMTNTVLCSVKVLGPLLDAFHSAFQAEDMMKTKRLRDVLKSLETMIGYVRSIMPIQNDIISLCGLDILVLMNDKINKISPLLSTLAQQSNSAGMQKECQKLSDFVNQFAKDCTTEITKLKVKQVSSKEDQGRTPKKSKSTAVTPKTKKSGKKSKSSRKKKAS